MHAVFRFNNVNNLIPKRILLSKKVLMTIAYLYIAIPVIIFFAGWLSLPFSFIFSFVIILGLICLFKDYYQRESSVLEIETVGLILILIIAFAWVYSSGVGGFWPQREDWHWRNANLRDLIDYSWPVIYPKTGYSLVYYFNYFLPAALVGKIMGWNASNVFLLSMTFLGVVITLIFIGQYLGAVKWSNVLAYVTVFVVFAGLEVVRRAIFPLLGVEGLVGYQLSSHTTLLQWVTNQTIIPWVAMGIFLNDRKIRNYIFLGGCVFAAGPLPFVGLLFILITDGVAQLFNKEDNSFCFVSWIKEVLSFQNICALSIFAVYILFYLCNSAATGNGANGGFGLYISISAYLADPRRIINLISFLLFNVIIYAAVLWKDFKSNYLYWVANISLCVFPLFRVGIGNDFGMRSVIPAEFLMSVFLSYSLLRSRSLKRRYIIVSFIAILMFDFYSDTVSRKLLLDSHSEKEMNFMDRIETFANKASDIDNFSNYLCYKPQDEIFYKFTSKNEEEAKRDNEVSEEYLSKRGYSIVDGEYNVHSVDVPEYSICGDTSSGIISINNGNSNFFVKSSYNYGTYEIFSENLDVQWLRRNEDDVFYMGYGEHYWANFDRPANQVFVIEDKGNGCTISNGNKYLTLLDGCLVWMDYSGASNQLWLFGKSQ